MNVMIHQQAEREAAREAQRMQTNREELIERIARAVCKDGTVQPLSGLHLSRSSVPLERVHSVMEPSVCVIAQGSKEVLLGDRRYRYNASQYLLVPVEQPYVVQIFEASKERPFLGLRLDLTPTLVGSVLLEAGLSSPPGHDGVGSVAVSSLDVYLLEAAVRLVRLLDVPAEVPVLLASGYSDKAAAAVAEGFTLLNKPYNLEALRSALGRLLTREAERAAGV